MGIDVEAASRDELVAFYNANLAIEGNTLSPASSKVAAQAAVQAALVSREAAERGITLVEAAGELEAAVKANTLERLDAVIQEIHPQPGTAELVAVPAGEAEVDAEAAEPDEEESDEPEPWPSEEQIDSLFDEIEEFDCNLCGDLGLHPRCPACATERVA